jgi:hypothetical protein
VRDPKPVRRQRTLSRRHEGRGQLAGPAFSFAQKSIESTDEQLDSDGGEAQTGSAGARIDSKDERHPSRGTFPTPSGGRRCSGGR